MSPTAQLATVATAIAGSKGAPNAIRLIVANAVVISIDAIMVFPYVVVNYFVQLGCTIYDVGTPVNNSRELYFYLGWIVSI